MRCYYANGNSPAAAIRQYKRENNLIRDPCSTSSVTRMVEKFERTYSLLGEKHERSSLGENRKELIAEAIEDSRGRISVREVSRSTDIPSASAHRIMRKSLSLKPLKFAMMKALEPQDYQKRV